MDKEYIVFKTDIFDNELFIFEDITYAKDNMKKILISSIIVTFMVISAAIIILLKMLIHNNDEIGQIAQNFNKMADAIEHRTDCGLYCELHDLRTLAQGEQEGQMGYNTLYLLRYMRQIDGTFVSSDFKSKHEEGFVGKTYVKKFWSPEVIEIRINANGIVGFDYNAPLDMMDTVVDKSSLKSFEEVKGTFEKMVVISNAGNDSEMAVNIDIDRVVLGYVRISEKDSYDTGLMVLAWDFIGKIGQGYIENGEFVPMKNSESYESVVTPYRSGITDNYYNFIRV